MLKQFIEQLSLPETMVVTEEGSTTLLFEPGLRISLSENSDFGITLHTTIAPFPSEKREEFLLRLMEANLLGGETGKAILGLDRSGKEVTFTLFLPPQLSYKDFHDRLEDFTNYAEAWRVETLQFGKAGVVDG